MKKDLKLFKGKKILVTGHTGFKGSWLCKWLLKLEANVVGISKDIPTNPSIFKESSMSNEVESYFQDLSDMKSFKSLFNEIKPDYVFHLAAQPIVISSYKDPVNTIQSNAIGTLSVLEALRNYTLNCVAVLITSDKVYDNVEMEAGYTEKDIIGGKDIYSASKGAAELLIRGYFESFLKDSKNLRIGIARAGNVIGGGDWAENRIVVDCVKAWNNNKKVKIRNPDATRPWQHVLEPLYGYMMLALNLQKTEKNNGEAFNFGPNSKLIISVSKLINELSSFWNIDFPYDIEIKNDQKYEAKLLKLNCGKAIERLKWHPKLDFEETIKLTSEWYKRFYSKEDINLLIQENIDFFEKKLD